MMKTMPDYEMMLMVAKARNMPQIDRNRLAQLAVLFVSYSMITTGLLTVFIWDALVFDKRDAMVLGPLPLRGSTIVGAKLAALATFLVGTALAVNVTSGVPFGFVTGGPEGHILRHLAGHLSGTIGGAVFVFSHARDCSRIAGAARQRACRGDGRVVSAVPVPQRSALLHDGADGDRAGDRRRFPGSRRSSS